MINITPMKLHCLSGSICNRDISQPASFPWLTFLNQALWDGCDKRSQIYETKHLQ